MDDHRDLSSYQVMFQIGCGVFLTGWFRVADREGSDSRGGNPKIARLGACDKSVIRENMALLTWYIPLRAVTATSRRAWAASWRMGCVGGVCFQSQMRVCRVGTSSMLECSGLLVLDTWNVAWHLSLLIHLRFSEEA